MTNIHDIIEQANVNAKLTYGELQSKYERSCMEVETLQDTVNLLRGENSQLHARIQDLKNSFCPYNYDELMEKYSAVCKERDELKVKKNGHWIIKKFGDWAECSVCGRSVIGAYDMDNSDNYCRCCGAKMD